MNKFLRFIPLGLTFAPVSTVLAVTVQSPPAIATDLDDFFNLICTATNLLFTVIMILAVIILLYAAFLFLTGGGSEDKTKQARQYILFCIIDSNYEYRLRSCYRSGNTF